MRLGLFGGSFDPVHRGHVEPVKAARRALELDEVIYLPTARPPHKDERSAPPWARYVMVELALLEEADLVVSAHEMTPGRRAYTVETLEYFRRDRPGAELFLLLGTDSFLDLPRWRRWREIPELARLAVMARGGYERDGEIEELEEMDDELRRLLRGGRVTVLDNPSPEVSSTEIRRRLAAGGEPPADMLPPLVISYLKKYPFYR